MAVCSNLQWTNRLPSDADRCAGATIFDARSAAAVSDYAAIHPILCGGHKEKLTAFRLRSGCNVIANRRHIDCATRLQSSNLHYIYADQNYFFNCFGTEFNIVWSEELTHCARTMGYSSGVRQCLHTGCCAARSEFDLVLRWLCQPARCPLTHPLLG